MISRIRGSTPASSASNAMPLRGYVFALAAALAYAASQVVARHGVSDFPAPLVGTTIALAFASLGFTLIVTRNRDARSSDVGRGAFFYSAAGLFSAIGVASLFLAVERAEVVVVSPVSSTHPLFTLLFAAILLRDLERLTVRIVIGAMLVVVGITLISLG